MELPVIVLGEREMAFTIFSKLMLTIDDRQNLMY
jgi:hypothetical protein